MPVRSLGKPNGIIRNVKFSIDYVLKKLIFFNIYVEVRQGCVLYQILFSIFINIMAKNIISRGICIKIKNQLIGILLYTDDIVIITNSKEELQKELDIVASYGKKWRCRYNTKKNTNSYIRETKKKDTKWMMGNKELKEVKNYRYLGIEM